MKPGLMEIYGDLSDHFGPLGWWPADYGKGTDPKFEIAAGAILTQQTQWKNVEKALNSLKGEGLLFPERILGTEKGRLESLLRPTGFYRQKAGRLLLFCGWLTEKYGGKMENFLKKELVAGRRELLSLNGIGKETADSILLYAGGKPVFVIDAYTRRMCKRLGITDSKDYEELRMLFEKNLPGDVEVYKEFHALIVELCKNYCRVRPVCGHCPLSGRCPKKY